MRANMAGDKWFFGLQTCFVQQRCNFLLGLRLNEEVRDAIICGNGCASCTCQSQAIIDLVQVITRRPVLSWDAISHKAWIAFFAKTDTPFCSTHNGQHSRPRTKDTYSQIILTCTKTPTQGQRGPPMLWVQQRFRSSPYIGIVGDDFAKRGVTEHYLSTGRHG